MPIRPNHKLIHAPHHREQIEPWMKEAKAAIFDRELAGEPVEWRSTHGGPGSICLIDRNGRRFHLRSYAPFDYVVVYAKTRNNGQHDLIARFSTPQDLYDYIWDFDRATPGAVSSP